jgi:flavin reductase (DIM6/NTAB) family NADH-FMN oxidoreductase RutF
MADGEARLIDVRTFWRAVGERAVGTAIVTARGPDGPAGFLALSATHLSADPPMMMVSIDRRTSALRAVEAGRHFAINYLAAGSEALADSFGGKGALKGADRFSEGQWSTLRSGAPVLTEAAGAIDCVLEEIIDRFGTAIAIGRVVDFASAPERRPLVSYRGAYL